MVGIPRDPAAVKLPFETGEYLCTWLVPDGGGGHREVPGLLTLEPGKYPTGVLYGNMPIEWISHEDGQRAAAFPQTHQFDVLTGRLSSGAHVALMDGELSYWFESQGSAIGAVAVLSLDAFEQRNHRAYSSIELQIEGLEALAGISPILQTRIPARPNADPTYSVTTDREARWEWTSGNHSMSFRYDSSTRFADMYEFRMVFAPVLRIVSDEPLTAVDWWRAWVHPLRQLVSVLTNGPREIRYLITSNDDDESRSHRDQVFGWDIAQAPVNSTRAEVTEICSAVNLKQDDMSLLDLLRRWQELENDHHPLIETYGSMATTRDQHPRSEFLLLLQALEGLYGYENAAKRAHAQTEHSARRDSFIERAHALLSSNDIRFLKKFLMKRPLQGLDQALIEILGSLPKDVRPEMERLKLTRQVRSENAENAKLRVEAVLVRTRNALSHGAINFERQTLDEAAEILDRVVRAEGIRILGGPESAQVRALTGEE